MITATVKHNDNYADIEFPCSEAYLSAKLIWKNTTSTRSCMEKSSFTTLLSASRSLKHYLPWFSGCFSVNYYFK